MDAWSLFPPSSPAGSRHPKKAGSVSAAADGKHRGRRGWPGRRWRAPRRRRRCRRGWTWRCRRRWRWSHSTSRPGPGSGRCCASGALRWRRRARTSRPPRPPRAGSRGRPPPAPASAVRPPPSTGVRPDAAALRRRFPLTPAPGFPAARAAGGWRSRGGGRAACRRSGCRRCWRCGWPWSAWPGAGSPTPRTTPRRGPCSARTCRSWGRWSSTWTRTCTPGRRTC